MIRKISAAVFLCMIWTSFAGAEERLGVQAYPGAKFDQAMSQILMKNTALKVAAFRTDDKIGKVSDFYRKKGLVLLKFGSQSDDLVRFKDMKNNVDVVVQQPWKDPRTNEMKNDTLILIMQEAETPGR
jgi:hypothetical protein